MTSNHLADSHFALYVRTVQYYSGGISYLHFVVYAESISALLVAFVFKNTGVTLRIIMVLYHQLDSDTSPS